MDPKYEHNGKTRKIRELTKKELEELIEKSDSTAQIIKNIGYTPKSSYYKVVREKIKEYDLDEPVWINNCFKKRELNEILVKNSTYTNRKFLKKRLFANGYLQNKCYECGIGPKWNGKQLSLQLDHINGINDDNRLLNLRILCPNCHSQTETFAGKRLKIDTKCECGGCISRVADKCAACDGIQRRVFEVTKEELEKLLFEDKMSFVALGKKYGVSDNAIRKRCKILGINCRKSKIKNT